MENNFKTWYQVADKKFVNIFNAFDESVKTKEFAHFCIDPDFYKALTSVSRPKNYSPDYIQSLIAKQLRVLRKKYSYIRLAYTGGTDSHTILKVAMDNKIYIDETWTVLVSLKNDKEGDKEYLPGLTYAKQFEGTLIGKVTTITPNIKDYWFRTIIDWWKNPKYLRGQYVSFRQDITSGYLNKLEKGITIVGTEKPFMFKKNKKWYWFTDDSPHGEFMGLPNIYSMYMDKNNPELPVAQTYASLDFMKNKKNIGEKNIEDRVEFKFENLNNINRLECFKKLGCYILTKDLGLARYGKGVVQFNNQKHQFAKKELVAMNRSDIVEKWLQTNLEIYEEYKNYPYMVELKDQKYVKTVNRYSKFLEITDTGLKI